MEIQKIFSDMYDEERLYSVLLTEDEMALYQAIFSDEGHGALEGAGAATLGLGAAAGLGYGAKEGMGAIARISGKRRRHANKKAIEKAIGETTTVKEARENLKNYLDNVKKGGLSGKYVDEGIQQFKDKVTAAEKKAAESAFKNGNIKKKEAGIIERLALKGNKGAGKAMKALGHHKTAVGLTAAGAVAAGAGVGAYAKHRKSKKD